MIDRKRIFYLDINETNFIMESDDLRSLMTFLRDNMNSFEPRRVVAAYSEFDVLLNRFATKFMIIGPVQIELLNSGF